MTDHKPLSVIAGNPHKHNSPALDKGPDIERPSREEAEQAVRTLIRWAGDDPAREGLLETPDRVVRSYEIGRAHV